VCLDAPGQLDGSAVAALACQLAMRLAEQAAQLAGQTACRIGLFAISGWQLSQQTLPRRGLPSSIDSTTAGLERWALRAKAAVSGERTLSCNSITRVTWRWLPYQ